MAITLRAYRSVVNGIPMRLDRHPDTGATILRAETLAELVEAGDALATPYIDGGTGETLYRVTTPDGTPLRFDLVNEQTAIHHIAPTLKHR